MKLTLGLAIALAASLIANGVLGWRLAGAKPRCEASKATATVDANDQVRREETTRDTALDKVTAATGAATRDTLATTQEQTRERAQTIQRVVVRGDCRRPDGLPALDAAVDQAIAAAGD